ncbi:MAG: FAD-dependent oxidoreductase, partial [Gammaproteobacteria bacterium]|nr:FAD-dependent oxidoreductase [Gammaproteobacteria bacterium]
VVPRDPLIEGQDHPKVLSYIDVLRAKVPVGKRVAIIGAGGIGFDVAEFLLHDGHSPTMNLDEWLAEWGVVDPAEARGGIALERSKPEPPPRELTLLQRKAGKHGANLGKTTGWIHRATLKMNDVRMIGNVNYERIGDEGLLITYGEKHEDPTWIDVDNIILCAGQLPLRELKEPLASAGIPTHVIGGADVASELDAKRAINQGSRLAAQL